MSSIQITGVHLELNDEVRNYVTNKIEKIKSHFDHVTNSHVILKMENKNYIAEARLNTPGHGDLFAEASAHEIHEAIDLLSEKLDRQMMKRKQKTQHPE